MTYLEKAKELIPNVAEEDILKLCPDAWIKNAYVNCQYCDDNYCQTCWNREMPEVKDS